MAQQWYIGTSGFSYASWKPDFYPPGLASKNWFSYYAERFNTLELNSSFYRFPQLKNLQSWYNKAPSGFLFSIKAPRLITHMKQMNECTDLLSSFYDTCAAGLQEKLGAILFQFPPKFAYSPERFEKIQCALDPAFKNVVEFRNESWWNAEIVSAFGSANIICCGSSYPGLPQQVLINNPIVYYRFHGIEKLFYAAYDEMFLQNMADVVLHDSEVKQVFCFFNNTAEMAAIENAKYICSYVQDCT